jgi:hypothetical protein
MDLDIIAKADSDRTKQTDRLERRHGATQYYLVISEDLSFKYDKRTEPKGYVLV